MCDTAFIYNSFLTKPKHIHAGSYMMCADQHFHSDLIQNKYRQTEINKWDMCIYRSAFSKPLFFFLKFYENVHWRLIRISQIHGQKQNGRSILVCGSAFLWISNFEAVCANSNALNSCKHCCCIIKVLHTLIINIAITRIRVVSF